MKNTPSKVLRKPQGSACFATANTEDRMQSQGIFTLMNEQEFGDHLAHLQVQRKIDRIQNHHTWKPDYSLFRGTNHFDLLEGMRRTHTHDNGWSNIGQNLTTFSDGQVAICRPLDTKPACIAGSNTGAIGIEHVGNFDTGHDELKPEHEVHKQIIIAVNAMLCKKFSFAIPSTQNIVYHHWYELRTGRRIGDGPNTKSCPGTAFFGGNSEADCARGFLPLVTAKLATVSAVVPPAVQAALGSGNVTAATLNVRDRASLNGVVLRQLPCGAHVQVYARTAGMPTDWLRMDATKSEWVSAAFIKLD